MRSMRWAAWALAAAMIAALAPAGAIVGGTVAAPGEFSFMAAIYTGSSPSSGQYCGGSLVKPRVVVTAAHCVDDLLDNTIAGLPTDLLGLKVKVMLGRTTLNGTGGEQIYATSLHVSPNSDSDVAVIQLAQPSSMTPIPIARPGQESYWAAGVTSTVAGWGATSEGGSGSNQLRKASIPIVSDAQCSQAYPGEIVGSTMLCAGYPQGGVDTCQGDSGGPLTVPGPGGARILAGATSFGEGCARAGKPGVYAEIAAAASFIDQYS